MCYCQAGKLTGIFSKFRASLDNFFSQPHIEMKKLKLFYDNYECSN